MKTFLYTLALCLVATATNATEKTYAQMSADGDGWIYVGLILMLGVAALALATTLIEVIITIAKAKRGP